MKKSCIISILFACLLCACSASPPHVLSGLEVHFIDVGEGDSILIRDAASAILIDAGSDTGSEEVVSYLHSLGIKTLTIAVGTHPHEDHIGSLDEIIEQFSPETIAMPKISSDTDAFEEVLNAVEAQNKKIKTAQTGLCLKAGAIMLTFLSPPRDADFEEINDWSAVIKMEFAGKTFLFCGDAERPAEKRMLEDGFLTKCDVLKVGHHGSQTSTSEEFLEAVSPKYAVISVGAENKYAFPSETVLKSLQKAGITVMRTDLSGNIICTISTDGKLTFKYEKGDQNAA